MKNIFWILFLSFLILSQSGCLTTLYPIFHEGDAIFNEQLLGYWKCSDKSKETGFVEINKIPDSSKLELPPNIQKISHKGYLVSRFSTEGKINGEYFVFLAKIGKNYYLDYYPAEIPTQKNVNRAYASHYIKVHSNYRCDFTDKDHFEMKLFDRDFLDKLIHNKQINIRHEVIEGKNIITASTDDLQKFIIQYSDNPDAYGGDITYCSRMINL